MGFLGVDDNGVLYSPSGRRLVRLPKRLAFSIHRLWGKYACGANW